MVQVLTSFMLIFFILKSFKIRVVIIHRSLKVRYRDKDPWGSWSTTVSTSTSGSTVSSLPGVSEMTRSPRRTGRTFNKEIHNKTGHQLLCAHRTVLVNRQTFYPPIQT